MESSSASLSWWDLLSLLLLRPLLAIACTLAMLFTEWYLVWNLFLKHIPLVQDLFELNRKRRNPRPRRRYTELFKALDARKRDSHRNNEQQTQLWSP